MNLKLNLKDNLNEEADLDEADKVRNNSKLDVKEKSNKDDPPGGADKIF